jgi:hypothetical protein
MTRRCFSLVLASFPSHALPRSDSRPTVCLLAVHDLNDFVRRFTSQFAEFKPARIVIRNHPDFWPGTGFPRRWEAWLDDASGSRAVRVVADPAYAALPSGRCCPEALAIARSLSRQWSDG